VIKLDIINEVVNRTGITKTKAEMAVETVFESMKRSLAKGDRIELRGFGVFNVRPRKTGIGRNPRTGAEVSIPPGKAVRFKPARSCSRSSNAIWHPPGTACGFRRSFIAADSFHLFLTSAKRGTRWRSCRSFRMTSGPRPMPRAAFPDTIY